MLCSLLTCSHSLCTWWHRSSIRTTKRLSPIVPTTARGPRCLCNLKICKVSSSWSSMCWSRLLLLQWKWLQWLMGPDPVTHHFPEDTGPVVSRVNSLLLWKLPYKQPPLRAVLWTRSYRDLYLVPARRVLDPPCSGLKSCEARAPLDQEEVTELATSHWSLPASSSSCPHGTLMFLQGFPGLS